MIFFVILNLQICFHYQITLEQYVLKEASNKPSIMNLSCDSCVAICGFNCIDCSVKRFVLFMISRDDVMMMMMIMMMYVCCLSKRTKPRHHRYVLYEEDPATA